MWRVYLPVAILSYGVMLVFWPWAQSAPITHPLSALSVFSHEIVPTKILFDGCSTLRDGPVDLFARLYRLGAARADGNAAARRADVAAVALFRRRGTGIGRVLPLFMLGFTIVFPVAYAIAIKAVLFNGMRHFIFVLPPIAVAAALVADIALELARRLPYRRPYTPRSGCTAWRMSSVMVMLHPDQYVYYNGFVGGVAAPRTSSSSTTGRIPMPRRCADWKIICASNTAPISRSTNSPSQSAGRRSRRAYYFPPNFRTVVQREEGGFRDRLHLGRRRALSAAACRFIGSTRMGALLSVVVDHREYLAEQRIARQPLAGATPRPEPAY